MYGSGLYSQNGKPTPTLRFVFIASTGVFILSLFGITFLVIGLVALVSNNSATNLNARNSEIYLEEEKILNGFTDLRVTIHNAGYLFRIEKKKFNCSNNTYFNSVFYQCDPKILASDNKTLTIKTENLNFTCDKDEKRLFWSIEWLIKSSTIKFDESYITKVLYSLKSCTSSKENYINKILFNSTIEISGILVFIEDNNLIEKEYKNCNLTLQQLDNSIKPCIELKNATIPDDLSKTPITLKHGALEEVLSENITLFEMHENFSKLNSSEKEFKFHF